MKTCVTLVVPAVFPPRHCVLSGRSAAWLARLVRDQEVEGSNPFAPTTLDLFFQRLRIIQVMRFANHAVQ